MSDVATNDRTWDLVKAFTNSPLCPQSLAGKPRDAYLIVRKGDEMGWTPMQSLDLINVIQGKVVISAEGMTSLIRAAGHGIELVEVTDTGCTVVGHRGDDTSPAMTITYTMEMAERAGLVKKGGSWSKNPEDMLWARAVSRLARWQFADVFTTHAYTPEDFGHEHEPAPALTDPQLDEAQVKADREPLPTDAVGIQQAAGEPEPDLEEAKANVIAALEAVELPIDDGHLE